MKGQALCAPVGGFTPNNSAANGGGNGTTSTGPIPSTQAFQGGAVSMTATGMGMVGFLVGSVLLVSGLVVL